LSFHDRTNRAARSKEKIGYIYFVFESSIVDSRAILINKLEWRDGMIDCVFAIKLTLTKDGEFFVLR
jgi:hypothetical protein